MIRNDLDPLILDLLEWIGREPRSYADVIDAWRTSCPRLTVWEDAMDRGFAAREHAKGREVMIRLTAAGREFLREHGRIVAERNSRVPGAMQRVALAKRCFAEPGPPYHRVARYRAPALQRTASQELRAALRPGHGATPSRRRTPCGRRRGPAAAGSSCGRR